MRKIGFILIFLILLIFGTVPSFACSPTATPSPIPQANATNSPISLEERAFQAPIIFIGTVVNGETCSPYSTYLCTAEIEVERYLKGAGEAIVWVEGFGVGTDCNPVIQRGDRRIFFVASNSSGSFEVLYFSYSEATPAVTDETILSIQAITNQSNLPPPLPLDLQISRFLSRYAWLIGDGLVLIIAISLSALWLWRRGRGKSKAKRGLTD